jgi:nicotinamidase-related amidase
MLLHESSLLVVDAQRGFTTLCPKELPVPGGLKIVPNVNRLWVSSSPTFRHWTNEKQFHQLA